MSILILACRGGLPSAAVEDAPRKWKTYKSFRDLILLLDAEHTVSAIWLTSPNLVQEGVPRECGRRKSLRSFFASRTGAALRANCNAFH